MNVRVVGLALTATVSTGVLVVSAWLLWPRNYERAPWLHEVPATVYQGLKETAVNRTYPALAGALATVDPAQQLALNLRWSPDALTIRDRIDDVSIEVRVPILSDADDADAPAKVQSIEHRPTSTPQTERPLQGLRVLVDPGHYGGAWSEIEKRHITLEGVDGVVREGDLNYGVGRVLEQRLTRLGAEVKLTRGPPPQIPFDATVDLGEDIQYDESVEASLRLGQRLSSGCCGLPRWLYPSYLGHMLLVRERERLHRKVTWEDFLRHDLRRRALLSESFGADITLSIHHNVTLGRRNGVMVFAPGNFLLSELSTPSDRFYALRRALDGSLSVSVDVGRQIAIAMSENLELPPLPNFSDAPPGVAFKYNLDEDVGLYARNLAILKRAKGPALLLEGPCMNHPKEMPLLLGQDLVVDGVRYPARVDAYATGVVEGLLASREVLMRNRGRWGGRVASIRTP